MRGWARRRSDRRWGSFFIEEGTRPPRPAGEAVGAPLHFDIEEGTRPPRPAGEAVGAPLHRGVRFAHVLSYRAVPWPGSACGVVALGAASVRWRRPSSSSSATPSVM